MINYDNSTGMAYLNAPRPEKPKMFKVEKYSLFVKTLKLVFPLIVVAIVAVLVSYLSMQEQGYIPDISEQTSQDKTTPGQIELLGAKYEGVDETGKSYTITADRANRVSESDDNVAFEKPFTDIFLGDETWLALRSEGGFFNNVMEKLILQKSVKAFHDSGYELDMKDIEIDMNTRSAYTSKPVTIQGPAGEAHAKGMKVMAGGEKIIFYGPLRMKLFNLSLIRGKN